MFPEILRYLVKTSAALKILEFDLIQIQKKLWTFEKTENIMKMLQIDAFSEILIFW